jgi:hypothetical protein
MSTKPDNTSPDSPTLSRRRMFAGAGGVGALAAVAAVLPSVKTEAPAEVQAAAADDKDGTYRVTEHVKRYYQTARV